MSTLYASAIPSDGFWYACTDSGQVVGKDISLDAVIEQAEAAGFNDCVIRFGHPTAAQE